MSIPKAPFLPKERPSRASEGPKTTKIGAEIKKAKKLAKKSRKIHIKKQFKYNEELSRKIAIKVFKNHPQKNGKNRAQNPTDFIDSRWQGKISPKNQ